jgi:hypothetical protein
MPGATAPTPYAYSNLIDTAVAQQFMRTVWENTTSTRAALEKLKSKGRVSFDGSGKYVEWTGRVGEYDMDYRADLANRTFTRQNHFVPYVAGWSFMDMTAAVSERDLMFAKSDEAIIQLRQRMLTDMGGDFAKKYNKKILQECGGAYDTLGSTAYAGGLQPLLGLPTLFQYGTSTKTAALAYNPATQTVGSTVAASDKEVTPNGTYCGVSTHPTNAIAGISNRMKESTSPVIANWSCTGWNSGGLATWIGNCLDVTSHLISRLRQRDGDPDLGILNLSLYNDFRSKLRSSTSQQIVLTDDAPRSPDAGLLPRLYIPFEGVPLVVDIDAPSNVLYILNTREASLKVFPQEPAGTGGPLKGNPTEMFKVAQAGDIDQGAFKVVATIASQMWFNPYHQACAFNFA